MITDQEVRDIQATLGKILNAVGGWQPIGTAPKDGTIIIVSGGIAHWHDGVWKSLTGFDFPGRPLQWVATRWMPMPVAPQP